MEAPWGTEETLQERMTRLLSDAHAEADNGNLDSAVMNAEAALEAWREAGEPDSEGEEGR